MMLKSSQLRETLTLPQFPRSANYDPIWLLENLMGPHPLRLPWLEICLQQGYPTDESEAAMLRADAGQNLGFTRVIARKND